MTALPRPTEAQRAAWSRFCGWILERYLEDEAAAAERPAPVPLPRSSRRNGAAHRPRAPRTTPAR